MAYNPAFPKTPEQRHFEDISSVLLKILSELPEKDRTKVFNFAVNLYNKHIEKMEVKHNEN